MSTSNKRKVTPSEITSVTEAFVRITERFESKRTVDTNEHMLAVRIAHLTLKHRDVSWKTKSTAPDDSDYLKEGYFIVGIDTPKGRIINQFRIELYWDLFLIPEVDAAPKFGPKPTDEQLNERLHSLDDERGVVHG